MSIFQRRRWDRDLAAEIEAHLELERDRLVADGLPGEEARLAARRAFGNRTAVEEEFYESRRWLWWEHLRQDTRFAARVLWRSPGFTAAAMVTLALGIGANTAIFSAIDEALFRPLPVPHAEQLAQVYSFNRKSAAYVSSSFPDYADFARSARSFQQLAAYVRLPLGVTVAEHTERVAIEAVTANYFGMLQLTPKEGRVFREEDDVAGAAPVALIGEDFRRTRFAGEANVLGRTVWIEDRAFTIVGVTPRRYRGSNLNWGDAPQVWIPLAATPLLVPTFQTVDAFHNRRVPWLVLVGRLKAGVTADGAQAELQTIAANVAKAEPATNPDLTAVVFELSRSKFWPTYRESIARSLAVFGVAAGLVLLLACANVSNLLLERAMARRAEFAIRLSMGAGRGRLVRQLLTESLLLAAPSFLLALAVARGLTAVLLHFPNALGLTLALDLGLEGRVLAFCAALSLGIAVLFGLAPASQAARADVLPWLKDAGNARSPAGRDWLKNSLVVAQVAFSVILLVGGGLFGRSLLKAYSIDLGFRSDHLLTVAFSVPPNAAASERFQGYQRSLVERLATVAGVQAVTLASNELISPVHSRVQVMDAADRVAPVSVDRNLVGPGYLATLGMGLVAGREFTAQDGLKAPRVAIVNQSLAARLWPGAAAVGRSLWLQGGPVEVVGVARDAKYGSVWETPQPYLYLPLWQGRTAGGYLVVRGRVMPESLAAVVREQWSAIAPRAPLYDVRTGEEAVARILGPQRMAAGILGAFGLLAVLLATIGLYSVMACWVARRRREIGIRMAIGARPRAVVLQVLRKAMSLALLGLAAGVLASGMLMRLIRSQVKDVSPYDGATFGAVVGLLVLVTIVAAVLPARRAARIDPYRALRCD